MSDLPSTKPAAFTLTDACTLITALALGTAFGVIIHTLAVGLGSSLAIGVAANLARRAGIQHWMIWLAIYSLVVLAACTLKLAGHLK